MGHEDNCFSPILDRVFNGGKGAVDTLGVGDFLIGIQWDIEVDLRTVSCQS
jgi:hypothetical protein